VPGLMLAAVSPDNTPHGYNWTFAFPMLLFAVVAVILYALFSRPHRRVPGRPIGAASAPPAGQSAARAASVAAGPSLAPGGGSTESHAEPSGSAQMAAGTGSAATAVNQSASPQDDSGEARETAPNGSTEAGE
jgi:hypothetical protein